MDVVSYMGVRNFVHLYNNLFNGTALLFPLESSGTWIYRQTDGCMFLEIKHNITL